jgi:YD repeat-containing protein
MFRKVNALKSLSLFLIVNTSTVAFGFALAYRWSRQTTSASQTSASLALPGSNKEQDGLNGAVHQVRTETTRLLSRGGKLVEGPRQLMELTTYDTQGNRLENSYYLITGSAPAGKEEYEYDDKGNIAAMTVRDAGNAIVGKESYKYEFDEAGNWTKMSTYAVGFETGIRASQPTEITYRRITYYSGERLADAGNPNSSQTNFSDENRAASEIDAEGETEAARASSASRETFASLRGALEGWIASNNARDIEKQMSFYGAKLYFYYRARNVSRDSVQKDKARMFERAELIDVRADAPEIILDRDGRSALMRFRKQYVIKNAGAERYGDVLQELRWQHNDNGRWEIIGERDVRVMR